MNTIKSAFVRAVVAAAFVLSGCASLTAPLDADDIVASMQASSQGGGE
jgi:outer membrane murein-binding lipoprotein Lpp